jgi:hypothetical protein
LTCQDYLVKYKRNLRKGGLVGAHLRGRLERSDKIWLQKAGEKVSGDERTLTEQGLEDARYGGTLPTYRINDEVGW